MKKQIEKWMEEVESLKDEIQKREKAIEAAQDLCDHEFEIIGNTSHADIYQCAKCLKQEIY